MEIKGLLRKFILLKMVFLQGGFCVLLWMSQLSGVYVTAATTALPIPTSASQTVLPVGHACHQNSTCFPNSTCSQSTCTCMSSYYEIETSCEPRVEVGLPCAWTPKGDNPCVRHAFCLNGICRCARPGGVAKESGCGIANALNTPCQRAGDPCADPHASCREDGDPQLRCVCDPKYYRDSQGACAPRIGASQPCTFPSSGDNPCVHAAFCLNDTCQCVVPAQLARGGQCREPETLKCFECDETFHPAGCFHIADCGPHETCFTVKGTPFTSAASSIYTSGCMAVQDCPRRERSRHPHPFQTESCFDCCHEPLCNQQLCGAPDELVHQAVCGNCQNVTRPEDCTEVDFCPMGNTSVPTMCFVERTDNGFDLGCSDSTNTVCSPSNTKLCCDGLLCNLNVTSADFGQ